MIDDLQVFDTCLTAAEVVSSVRRDPRDPAAFEHFLVRHHQPYISALAELRRLREEENTLVSVVPEIMVMEEMRQPRPAHLLKRGAYDAPGEIVPRDTPASLPPFPKNQPRNRLGLARWLTDRGHPLAARVVVNRIWRMHFGRGLVATQEDFGSQGKLPSHPAAARLARRQVHGRRLGREGASQAHRLVGDIPAVVARVSASSAGATRTTSCSPAVRRPG